jgi:hypothetical protein
LEVNMGMPPSVQGLRRESQAVTTHATRHKPSRSTAIRQHSSLPLLYWKPIAAAGIVTVTFMVTVAVAMRPAPESSERVRATPSPLAAAASAPKPQPVVATVETPTAPVGIAQIGVEPKPVDPVAEPVEPKPVALPPVEAPRQAPVVFADVKPFETVAPAPVQVAEEKPVAVAVVPEPRDAVKLHKPRPGCANFGTFVDFVRSPQKAMRLAKDDGKLVFLLHVSGDFDDDAFT